MCVCDSIQRGEREDQHSGGRGEYGVIQKKRGCQSWTVHLEHMGTLWRIDKGLNVGRLDILGVPFGLGTRLTSIVVFGIRRIKEEERERAKKGRLPTPTHTHSCRRRRRRHFVPFKLFLVRARFHLVFLATISIVVETAIHSCLLLWLLLL